MNISPYISLSSESCVFFIIFPTVSWGNILSISLSYSSLSCTTFTYKHIEYPSKRALWSALTFFTIITQNVNKLTPEISDFIRNPSTPTEMCHSQLITFTHEISPTNICHLCPLLRYLNTKWKHFQYLIMTSPLICC